MRYSTGDSYLSLFLSYSESIGWKAHKIYFGLARHKQVYSLIVYSCIDIYAHSCLRPFSIGRKPCSNSKTHVQIMKFTCRLNMGFGKLQAAVFHFRTKVLSENNIGEQRRCWHCWGVWGFGRRHWSMRRDVMCFVETKWPTLKKLRSFRWVFTLLMLFSRDFKWVRVKMQE